MSNFLICVEHDATSGTWVACFSDGGNIELNATNYHDAVLEADQLTVCNYELGYN